MKSEKLLIITGVSELDSYICIVHDIYVCDIKMIKNNKTSVTQNIFRILLAAFMI